MVFDLQTGFYLTASQSRLFQIFHLFVYICLFTNFFSLYKRSTEMSEAHRMPETNTIDMLSVLERVKDSSTLETVCMSIDVNTQICYQYIKSVRTQQPGEERACAQSFLHV